eukprot:NODE_413_length_9103_cov_0.450911.p5 type:complete len:116 gc:universal NODE_413_length_9103_cov_0.450911:2239-2586(+)
MFSNFIRASSVPAFKSILSTFNDIKVFFNPTCSISTDNPYIFPVISGSIFITADTSIPLLFTSPLTSKISKYGFISLLTSPSCTPISMSSTMLYNLFLFPNFILFNFMLVVSSSS